MKTRYKILIVIGGTIFVYTILTVLLSLCMSFSGDCTVFRDANIQTRLIIPGGMMWDTANGIGEWSGTAQGFEETKPGIFIEENHRFILFFIIVPIMIISGLVIWDKRK
ncbi:MAG: hypothetical protein K5798_03025 [Nitrosopumilus sp.]|uniref:hypothetical protein n=1 Tax=Nitrosopumilus sp. TaxID=2024843 RepID=UPI00242C0DDA|nr:hypothetical protein [Nitrosopumilus sp.]MCV0366223.1 hypothetical protein [Nitrosopumilus sp.]